MDPLTRLHAPNLECLTISSDKDGSSEGVLLHRPQLLSNEVLRLKALAVQPAMSWMPSNYFPALTRLHLSFGPNQPESLCVYDVLPLLSNTPQLQFAHIAGILYSWMRMPSTATVLPIALPRLRSLTCTCWAHVQVVRLLALLELPERCWVRLQDIAIDPSGEGYPAPVPQLALMNHTTHLEIASSLEHLLLVSEGKSSGFWIETHIDDGSATWNHWLAQLHSTMPLANITSLHANIHSEQHLFWPAVLRHMPRLSCFDVVVGSFVPGHAHPLSILCGLLSQTPVLIPALRELRLQLVENTHSSFHPTPPLLCILESRGHLGCRLHRLAVQLHATEPESDTLGQELAAALSGYVDVFELVSPLEPPLCEFKMRDVWRVEGSEVYWKPDDLGEPCYSLPAF